jgi:hypothetical protein
MERPRTSLKSAGWLPAFALSALLLGGGAIVAARLWLERAGPTTASGVAPEVAAPSAAREIAPPAGADDPEREGEARRALMEGVAPSSPLRAALEGDFVRRWAVVLDNLAEGVSPRRELPFLAPSRPFTVVERGGTVFVDPASYRRYDAFAAAVAGADTQTLARAYRAARAPLEAAYRLLGYPEVSLDDVLSRALARIEVAPVEDGEVAVVDEGGLFAFSEPRLEGLRDVEKHLLRMGPRNTRLLQAKARDLREALGLPRSALPRAASL